MMMPRRAASETEPMIATGMAISSGHGVATTSTPRNRSDVAARCPGNQGDGDGQRRVDRPDLVAEPPQFGVAFAPNHA